MPTPYYKADRFTHRSNSVAHHIGPIGLFIEGVDSRFRVGIARAYAGKDIFRTSVTIMPMPLPNLGIENQGILRALLLIDWKTR